MKRNHFSVISIMVIVIIGVHSKEEEQAVRGIHENPAVPKLEVFDYANVEAYTIENLSDHQDKSRVRRETPDEGKKIQSPLEQEAELRKQQAEMREQQAEIRKQQAELREQQAELRELLEAKTRVYEAGIARLERELVQMHVEMTQMDEEIAMLSNHKIYDRQG